MENATAPRWLLWISIVFLIWNLIGLTSLYIHWTTTPAEIAALPQIQQDMMNGATARSWIAFVISTGAGTLAAIALLFRKRWAAPLFLISLISVIVQFTAPHLLSIAVNRDMSIMYFPAFIAVLGAVEWWLARAWSKAGWLV